MPVQGGVGLGGNHFWNIQVTLLANCGNLGGNLLRHIGRVLRQVCVGAEVHADNAERRVAIIEPVRNSAPSVVKAGKILADVALANVRAEVADCDVSCGWKCKHSLKSLCWWV